MNNILDVVPSEHRVLIMDELTRRNPDLLAELRTVQKPTNDQSDTVVDALSHALS
ncbi:hypothetical protein H7I55_16880, partial [Mycolicibacterium setense]|nr:hypothetical protein [Mycolicibacterium setense]